MEFKDAFLIGKKVYLRPLKVDDANGNYPNWFNDPEVCKYNRHAIFPNTYEKTRDYIESIFKSINSVVLAIIEKSTNKHIGNVTLSNINFIDRNAELSIIIGEKDCWGKGYGKESCKLLIDYAFNVLNLHRVFSGTHEDNIGFRNLAKSLGMVEEGTYKENVFKNGKYSDTVWYGILNQNHK